MRRFFSATKTFIEEQLVKAMNPASLEIINDSWMHQRGSDTHFKVHVVSEDFQGKTQVERERLVNRALKQAWEQGVISISVVAKTPEEAKADPKVSKSIRCMSHSKEQFNNSFNTEQK